MGDTYADKFRKDHKDELAAQPSGAAEAIAPLAFNSAPKPVVKIYVRMGDDRKEDERRVAFRIPEGIDALELLDLGFAIDGNQAAFTIAPYYNGFATTYDGPFEVSGETLDRGLVESQRALVAFLRERGFTPQFA